MNAEKSPVVTLIIQSGMIPENLLKQLINWRLLPEDYNESPGNRILEWPSAEEFVETLKKALMEEDGTIRETELNRSGQYKRALLHYSDSAFDAVENIYVDGLGRVILPPVENYRQLAGITFLDKSEERKAVAALEVRFQGRQESDYVLYLEPNKEDVNVSSKERVQ